MTQKWNHYKTLRTDQRTEQEKNAAIKSMAKVYCDANQLNIQTGKKIQQAQPQQDALQQGGPQA